MNPADLVNPVAGRDVVCVGFNDWDNEVWTNQHHLMARLAATGSRVLFIESLGLRRPSLASRDLRRIGRRLRRGFGSLKERDGVMVLSPLIVPLHSNRVVRVLNTFGLRMRVRYAARQLGLHRPVLWAYVPQAETLLQTLDPELVVYHCVDDIAAQEGVDADSFRAAEERFARRADLVLASAPALADKMRRLSDNVLFTPNVADTALFATALAPGDVDHELASLREPRLVFVGAIVQKKLDFEVLCAVADARPEWSIALVGPVGLGDPETDVSVLAARPNIHLIGSRRQAALPALLRGAAVGLIPYRSSRLTESIFPMKVYEYLAAGLPVVAAGLPALDGVAGVVLVQDAWQMIGAIESVLLADDERTRAARSEAALKHSWETRLGEIAAALAQ